MAKLPTLSVTATITEITARRLGKGVRKEKKIRDAFTAVYNKPLEQVIAEVIENTVLEAQQ